ncbi:PPR domain-containing protein/PPR_1 domain-containing protein/PPR_2 domain-containing protein [Cephalotus follicularis]|uniref:PPR domain-containing protein/PPR_1 domain-containing protein/PPR_2 domain-containing protein n=1 Tax=Cephalotus follicularis TaxID=3775 RepID=A0A1Q3B3W1_CEPFO|nr:PPR domain-containing protein/PPR_1 domain-containing protein/PPR_2 domain-containing protein [Cephalotus follicularis]
MSLQNLLKTLKTVKRFQSSKLPPKPYQEIQEFIPETLHVTTANLSSLNTAKLHQILSNPNLKASHCLQFFNYLLKNQTLISFKPDLQAHFTLICKLLKARDFSDAESLLKSLFIGENFRYPLSVVASTIKNCCLESNVEAKLFNLMLNVYSDSGKHDNVCEIFDYMNDGNIKIDEKTCTVHLLALKRYDQVGLALDFFYRMIVSGMEISVYSLTVVVDGLCTSGEIKKGRELVEVMIDRGLKPNIITYNIMINACSRRWNFEELDLILLLMEKEGESYNMKTYEFLIDGYSSFGKFEEAEKLVVEMQDKGLELDTHLYNLIIGGYCKLGLPKNARSLFHKMSDYDVNPNADTYWALVNGLCKIGEMEVATEYVSEMRNKGIELDHTLCNALIDGFCKKGMVNQAFELQVEMGKKGFDVDVSVCNKIVNALCESNRVEEAKMLLNIIVKRGVSPRVVSFNTLTNT